MLSELEDRVIGKSYEGLSGLNIFRDTYSGENHIRPKTSRKLKTGTIQFGSPLQRLSRGSIVTWRHCEISSKTNFSLGFHIHPRNSTQHM
jgi:hypothetical protein